MSSEPIDIEKYRWIYVNTLSEEEQQAIRNSHLERMKQGKFVWNTWAKQVLAAIEQTYPKNATEAEKLDIRNEYQIDFLKVTFNEEADFSGFIFPIAVNFTKATFSGGADFRWTTFSGEAYFVEATFSDRADFSETVFSGEAIFREATFSGEAVFWEATFCDKADFKQAIFFNVANFSKAEFSGEDISFLGAQFQQQSLFVDIKFSNIATAIPCDFRQTYFHLSPLVDDFPSDVSQFVNANKSIKRDKEFYKACEAKFRALKQLAERNNHHQKTLEFYGCELYCQRQASSSWRKPKNWVSYFYGLFSGYGLSLWCPFLFWLVVMLGSATLQAVNDNKFPFSPIASVNYERVGFYIAPSMPPFVGKPLYQKEVRHRLYPADKTKPAGQLSTANRFIRTIQTLMTFIALFLFGLALRNRFKIG